MYSCVGQYSCVGHGTEGFLLGLFRPGPLVLGVLCFPRLGRGGTRLNLAMSDWDIPPNPDTGYKRANVVLVLKSLIV